MTEEEKAAQAAAQNSATAVVEVDFDNLDDLLGIPSASSVIAPSEAKPTVLKSDKVDISFLDEIGDDDTESGDFEDHEDDSCIELDDLDLQFEVEELD
jgi:hypothetical protein